jgi:hypothetical protein
MVRAAKGLLICLGGALPGGGITGIGLATYARSGSFDFYKRTSPAYLTERVAAPAADYPPARSTAYPENPYPPRARMIARAAEPADYPWPASEALEAPPAIEETATTRETLPVIVPQKGSWSAPAEPETANEPAIPGETIY